MANYTDKDLSDILMDYIACKRGQVKELKTRTNEADSPLDLVMVAYETATLFTRLSTAASIIVDLGADEQAVTLSSQLLNDMQEGGCAL